MFNILEVFSKKDLETFFNTHPFRKRLILRRMKKAKITFEEKYYIHFKSRFHGDFWLTERHFVPVFYTENRHFALAIEECPFCTGEHFIYKDQLEVLNKNCPLLMEDFKYIARQASFKASKVYKRCITLGQTKEVADKEFTDAYIQYAKEFANDLERGKIVYFPTFKSS